MASGLADVTLRVATRAADSSTWSRDESSMRSSATFGRIRGARGRPSHKDRARRLRRREPVGRWLPSRCVGAVPAGFQSSAAAQSTTTSNSARVNGRISRALTDTRQVCGQRCRERPSFASRAEPIASSGVATPPGRWLFEGARWPQGGSDMADAVSESTWTGFLKNPKPEREWPARTR
jgi:hypothetical protein